MGRARKELTEEQIAQVEELAAVLTMEQIADLFGLHETTLRQRMTEDPEIKLAYKRGKNRALAGVGTNLIQQAHSGNTAAAIFYLKTQGGWRETAAAQTQLQVNLKELTDEQLERIAAGEDPARVLSTG
jgi:hypothetical protein